MTTYATQASLTLPGWVQNTVNADALYVSHADKMQLAIALSAMNVQHGTGGPFGAVIFNDKHQIVSVGVNSVVAQQCSIAHAEMMAFMLAQKKLQKFRLNQDGQKFTLATSAQPCCQCYGASFWAGIDFLLIGARAEDVHALTEFDEGPLPENWVVELEQRQIHVVRDVLRDEACMVLKAYQQNAGVNY